LRQSVAKCPVSNISTRSPGDSVDDGRLPSTGPRCGIDEDMAFRHLEDSLHAFEALLAKFRELGPAMVNGGKINRPLDAVGHIRWAGDLQEVTAGAVG
jgi:hypothetical protein